MRYWFSLALYMAAIVWFSSMSKPPVPALQWPHMDKVYHVVEYGVLGALAFPAFEWTLRKRGVRTGVIVAITVLFCIVFGVTDELHQRFVRMRQPSVYDLAADLVGSVVGIGLAYSKRMLNWRWVGEKKSS